MKKYNLKDLESRGDLNVETMSQNEMEMTKGGFWILFELLSEAVTSVGDHESYNQIATGVSR